MYGLLSPALSSRGGEGEARRCIGLQGGYCDGTLKRSVEQL